MSLRRFRARGFSNQTRQRDSSKTDVSGSFGVTAPVLAFVSTHHASPRPPRWTSSGFVHVCARKTSDDFSLCTMQTTFGLQLSRMRRCERQPGEGFLTGTQSLDGAPGRVQNASERRWRPFLAATLLVRRTSKAN